MSLDELMIFPMYLECAAPMSWLEVAKYWSKVKNYQHINL